MMNHPLGSLAKQLQWKFGGGVKRRGESYATRVKILEGSGESLLAEVRGTLVYTITIARKGSALEATCSCPYFASTGPCKHLWATLLVADRKGLLGSSDVARLTLGD